MDELKLLKDLLLGEEQKALDNIQHRLDDGKLRTDDIADVLPYAIQKRADKDNQLALALQQPVEECLRSAIRKDTNSFADVLFPVMGPAIRRSITETVRGMLQSINKTLDESFSIRGLSWRFESMRTGVPFYDIILRNTLIYRVEQTFLIQPDTGLLMQHMTAPDVPSQDPDVVSAMLTAIQDFASDSFNKDQEGNELETVNMGEHTLWLIHGPHALLACVIRGVAPLSLRQRFTEALEEIHRQYNDELTGFDGNRAPLYPTENILAECFISEQKDKEKKSNFGMLLVIGLIIAGLLGWWGYVTVVDRIKQNKLLATLNSTPGIVVLDHQSTNGLLTIKGLKDPFSTLPAEAISDIGYDQESLHFEWHQYQSAEPDLAMRRVERLLSPPEGISLALRDGVLRAEGIAVREWTQNAKLLTRLIPGIDAFDSSAVRLPDEVLLEQITAVLVPPDGISLALQEGVLDIEGEAPNLWLASVRSKLAAFSDLREIRSHQTKPVELEQIRIIQDELQGTKVFFGRGGTNLEDQTPNLNKVLSLINQLDPLYHELGEKFLVQIKGFTDGTGNMMLNQELAKQRAEAIQQWLVNKGVKSHLLETIPDISAAWNQDNGGTLEEMRRAEFSVKSNLDFPAKATPDAD